MSEPAHNLARVLLLGASGMVGRQVIARATPCADLQLVALARRELPLPMGTRLETLLADPQDWPDAIARIAPVAVICALGTTQARSGQAGLVAVDRDMVVQMASAAAAAGTRQFTLVSSVGADAGSRAFYLRTKGEAEDALRKMRFARLDILRPGLLRGARGEIRLAERAAMIASPVTDLLMQGNLRRYRSIRASVVADAALQATRELAAGVFVHEHDAILRLAKRLDQSGIARR